MPAYSFVVRNSDDTDTEGLGDLGLADDGKALTFGKQVIRDLMREGAEQYADWTMEIA